VKAKFLLGMLTVMMFILLLGCSQKEYSYKITNEYSDKISTEFAAVLIDFAQIIDEYSEIAFKNNERSDTEKLLSKEISEIQLDMYANVKELNSTEKTIMEEIVFDYAIDVSARLAVLKSRHQLALISKEMGVKEHEEYLEIDLIKYKEESNRIKGELSKYLSTQ